MSPVRGNTTPAHERVLRRCVSEDRGYATPCLIFTGALIQGYGTIRRDDTRSTSTHRVMWEHHHGPVPEGLELDHLCRQLDCCEVAHLEAVTHQENMIRSWPHRVYVKRTRRLKTHCVNGHEFTPDNTRPRVGGKRRCRTCANHHNSEYRKRRSPA